MRSIFEALAAEGIEVHIYPSRDNFDYQNLSDTVQNIFYHPSLPPDKLLNEIAQYDFGWAGFNDTLNRVHMNSALPNKLFEYIACGLPVISFPHEALKRFLETHHFGLVIDTVSGLTERLRNPGMAVIRENVSSHRLEFTVEANIGLILNMYLQLCEETTSFCNKQSYN